MLDVRKTIRYLHPRKLGREDLVRAKDFVERHANGSVARSTFSWILDGLTTIVDMYVAPIISSIKYPDRGQVTIFEGNWITKSLVEKLGIEKGLLAHNLLTGAIMYLPSLSIYGAEHRSKEILRNYKNDSDGRIAKVKRYAVKQLSSAVDKHLLSNFYLDFLCFFKYAAAATNLDILLRNANMPEPIQKTLYYAMWAPYVTSLASYGNDHI